MTRFEAAYKRQWIIDHSILREDNDGILKKMGIFIKQIWFQGLQWPNELGGACRHNFSTPLFVIRLHITIADTDHTFWLQTTPSFLH